MVSSLKSGESLFGLRSDLLFRMVLSYAGLRLVSGWYPRGPIEVGFRRVSDCLQVTSDCFGLICGLFKVGYRSVKR